MLESCPTQIYPAVPKAGLAGSVPQDGARRALPGRVSPPGRSEVGLAQRGQPPGQSEALPLRDRLHLSGAAHTSKTPGHLPCAGQGAPVPRVLRGGERRLHLPAPADLPTAGRVPHGAGRLLPVTAEALTGGIRAWWTQAGKPARVLRPRQAPLRAHRPCASLAPAGGPAAAARTSLGRICRRDGGWWGAGDLLQCGHRARP